MTAQQIYGELIELYSVNLALFYKIILATTIIYKGQQEEMIIVIVDHYKKLESQ